MHRTPQEDHSIREYAEPDRVYGLSRRDNRIWRPALCVVILRATCGEAIAPILGHNLHLLRCVPTLQSVLAVQSVD